MQAKPDFISVEYRIFMFIKCGLFLFLNLKYILDEK